MVDFRRMIPVLAVLALLLGLSVTASAQTPLTCIAAGGIPNQVPGEALAARMGDFVITCTGGTATPFGVAVPSVNISVTLGTINITSRLMSSSNTLPQLSEAVITLDEPLSPPLAIGQFGCNQAVCINAGNGAGLPIYNSASQNAGFPFTPTANRNIFQGTQVSNNQLTFFGVPVDPPGTSGSRIFRITNVRGNASQAGISNVATQIFETMSVSNPALLPVTNLATQAVASVQRGLLFSLASSAASTATFAAIGLQQCVSRTATDGTNPAIVVLRYTEGFGTAFLKRIVQTTSANPLATGEQNTLGNVPPGPYFTESGYTTANTSLQSNTVGGSCPGGTCAIGQADFGTRLKAVFNNLPAGVSIFVDRVATANGGLDVAQMTASETGGFTAVGPTTGAPGGTIAAGFGVGTGAAAQLPITNNSATAVWEVTDASPVSLATFNFRVWVIYTASPGTNSPALATATVNGSYAPTSTVTTPANGTIPRFADTSTAQNSFTVVPCVTNLLFPYLTSQGGFDTGIAISNTSTDPFLTAPQSQTCTLNWYGAAFTGATPTPTINSGTSYTTLLSSTLSSVTGGFSGYMIAQCRFQFAHGFAFISDLGARNLAMGYLALVIPDVGANAGVRAACGSSALQLGVGCVTSGENLSQ